jgi:hypothetical protein
MKRRPWLSLSLSLNVLLVAAVDWLALGPSPPEVRGSVSRFITNRVLRVRHDPPQPASTVEPSRAVVEVNEPFSWAQVESADYRVYLANLRGIGCPEQTVRDLVIADVDELFAARVKEMVDGVSGRFWRLLSRPGEFEKIVDEKKDELDNMKDERRALFAALFGDENPRAAEEQQQSAEARHDQLSRLAEFLPDEKRARFIAAEDEFDSAIGKISQTAGLSDPERRAKVKELQDAHERSLREWLAPGEYDELRLRQSSAAQIRSRLTGLDVSAEEARSLAKIQLDSQGAETSLERAGRNTGDTLGQVRRDATAQMRELLGPERFAAYERNGDNRFSPIQRVTQRVGLPDQVAVQVFEMRKTAEDRARQVAQNKSLADDARQATLEAIGEQTRRSLSDALGERGLAAYERLDGGWLQQMASARR